MNGEFPVSANGSRLGLKKLLPKVPLRLVNANVLPGRVRSTTRPPGLTKVNPVNEVWADIPKKSMRTTSARAFVGTAASRDTPSVRLTNFVACMRCLGGVGSNMPTGDSSNDRLQAIYLNVTKSRPKIAHSSSP